MSDEPVDNLELVRRDIVTLAHAVNILNNYGPRIGSVSAACTSILAPSPDESRAIEDLTRLKAARPKLGQIAHILADWDKDWRFVFQLRFAEGYWTGDGFDLREGTPGYNALVLAIDAVGLKVDVCDLQPPHAAHDIPLRRVIYPVVKEVQAVKSPTEIP